MSIFVGLASFVLDRDVNNVQTCSSFQLLVCIALTLNYANVYGYVKCRFGQNADNRTLGSTISSFTSDFIKKQFIKNVSNRDRCA